MKKKIYLIIIGIIILNTAEAQRKLSLQDAIDQALLSNELISITQLEISQAKNNLALGYDNKLPQLDFEVFEQNSYSSDNNPTSYIDGDSYTKNSLNGRLGASWKIYNGGAKRIVEHKLNTELGLAEAEGMIRKSMVVERTTLLYFRSVYENEKLEILEEIMKHSLASKEIAKSKYDAEIIDKFELNSYNSELLLDSLNYLKQKTISSNAKNEIHAYLQLEPKKKYNLTERLNVNLSPNLLASIEASEYSKSNQIQREELKHKISQLEVEFNKTKLKPTIELKGGISDELSNYRINNEAIENGGSFDVYGKVAFHWPIMQRKRIGNEVRKSETQEKIIKNEIKLLEREQQQELRNELNLFRQISESLKIHKTFITTLEENLKLSELRQENLQAGFLEVNTAKIKLKEARLELLLSQYELQKSKLKILRLTSS